MTGGALTCTPGSPAHILGFWQVSREKSKNDIKNLKSTVWPGEGQMTCCSGDAVPPPHPVTPMTVFYVLAWPLALWSDGRGSSLPSTPNEAPVMAPLCRPSPSPPAPSDHQALLGLPLANVMYHFTNGPERAKVNSGGRGGWLAQRPT